METAPAPVTKPTRRPCGLPAQAPVSASRSPHPNADTCLLCWSLFSSPKSCRQAAGLSLPLQCPVIKPQQHLGFPLWPSPPSSLLFFPSSALPSFFCPPPSSCFLSHSLPSPFFSSPLFSLALGRASGYPANNHSRSLWAPAPAVSMDEGPTQTWMLQLPCQPRTPHSTGLVGR